MDIEQAKEILKDYDLTDGNIIWGKLPLGGNPEYVHYWCGDIDANLDGYFTADELEAIAIWMRHHETKSRSNT